MRSAPWVLWCVLHGCVLQMGCADAREARSHGAHSEERAEASRASDREPASERADERAGERADERSERADEPSERADEPACRLEEAHAELSLGDATGVVAVARAVGADSLSAIVAAGEASLSLVQVRGDTLLRTSLAETGTMLGLAPSGDGFLLLTVGSCAETDAARCLRAHYLHTTDEGLVPVPPVELPQTSELRSLRLVATNGLVYLARSYRTARPTLDRFGPPRAIGAPASHARLSMADAVADDEPVEILALAADGAAWALVYRHGATEDPLSGVVLATQLDEHHVEALHDMLVVESIAWVGNSIAMVAAFEFARPAYLRLAPDGEMRMAPREIPFGMEVPEPFGGRIVARAEGEAGHVVIELRNGAGDRRGDRIDLSDARAADLAREPGGFLIAWLRGSTLKLSRLRC